MHGGLKPKSLLELVVLREDSNNAQHASLPGELFRLFKKKDSAAAEMMPLSRTSS